VNSKVGDAQFADTAKGDFTVNSAVAKSLGFINFAIDSFGRMPVPVDTGSVGVVRTSAINAAEVLHATWNKNQLTVCYSLDSREPVSIALVSVSGRHIADIFRGMNAAGLHTVSWTCGVDRTIAPSTYLLVVKTGNRQTTQKIVLVR